MHTASEQTMLAKMLSIFAASKLFAPMPLDNIVENIAKTNSALYKIFSGPLLITDSTGIFAPAPDHNTIK
jgi:hypothetical protein